MSPRSRVPTALLLVLTIHAGGCSPDFDPQSLVTTSRVLAIVADSPEIPLDGTTTLEAVLSFPEQALALSWTACPLSLGATARYACAAPEVTLEGSGTSAAFAAATIAPFLDGLGADFPAVAAALKQIVPQHDPCVRELLAEYDACVAAGATAACDETGAAAAAACLRQNGIDVTVHLVVQLPAAKQLDAYKRVRVRDAAAGILPNHNPGLEAVVVAGQTVRHGDTVSAAAGARLEMLPQLAADAAEVFVDETGTEVTETLFVSWYATAGDFKYIRSIPTALDDTLTLPAAEEMPAAVTVWLVAHDNRFGASWLSFAIAPSDGGTP